MENEPEVLEPQKNPEPSESVSLSQQELEDLRHRAEVSSQNYERAKKAEQRLKELEEARLLEVNVPSDEDDTVGKLKSEISEIKGKLTRSEVIESYPQLKEVWSDFEQFRSDPENKGMNMRTAAKAFLVDKGLLEPSRKGLEKPTGGPRAPLSSGMSSEDAKRLRETNYKKYLEMVKKGQIKVS